MKHTYANTHVHIHTDTHMYTYTHACTHTHRIVCIHSITCTYNAKKDTGKKLLWIKNALSWQGFRQVLTAAREGLWQSKRERILDLCSICYSADGLTIMLFASEGGDAKSSIIWSTQTQKGCRFRSVQPSAVFRWGGQGGHKGSDITSSFKGHFVPFVWSLQFCFFDQLVTTTQTILCLGEGGKGFHKGSGITFF